MSSRHILIVNARKVTQPVFVIGAPHSGAEAVGRALKISPGFHVTIGQQAVLQAVYGVRPASVDVQRPRRGRRGRDTRRVRPGLAGTARRAAWSARRSAGRRRGCAARRWGPASSSAASAGSATRARTSPTARRRWWRRSPTPRSCRSCGTAGTRWRRCSRTRWRCPGSGRAWPTSTSSTPIPSTAWRTRPTGSPGRHLSAAGKCALRWRGAIRLAARLRKACRGPAQDPPLRGHGEEPRRHGHRADQLHRE